MRVRGSRKRLIVALVGFALVGTFTAVAFASAGSGFAPATLVTAGFTSSVDLNNDRVKLQTKDPTDVRVQKIVIGANAYSGWHHHPGFVIVAVAEGAVTWTHSDCSSKTYGPGLPDGAVFVESGIDPGEATSVGGATVYATYVVPHLDSPVFRIEDSPPAVPCG